jgi:hypothetical protein
MREYRVGNADSSVTAGNELQRYRVALVSLTALSALTALPKPGFKRCQA